MKLKLFIAFVMIGALFCAVKIDAQPGHGESTSPPTVQFKQSVLQAVVPCPMLKSRVDANASETYVETKFYKTKIKSYQTFSGFLNSDYWGPAEARVVESYVQCKFEFENCGIIAYVLFDAGWITVEPDEAKRLTYLVGHSDAVKLCETIKTAFSTNSYVKLWYSQGPRPYPISVRSAELVSE